MKKSKDVEEDKCSCEEKCSEYVSWVNVTVGCFLIFVFIVFIIMLIIKRDKKADVEELTIEQIDRSLEERRKHNDELQKRLYRQRLRLLQKM
ncbi:unnamed protein product [Caenorhabditis brenneri]